MGIPTAALGILTAAASLGAGFYGQKKANDENKREAEKNREFQERMSSTAVQRSVQDYKDAGLNPALAYDRSASSPGGASATIGNTVSSAMDAKRLADDQRRAQQQHLENIRLTRASADNQRQQQVVGVHTANKTAAEAQLLDQEHRFRAIAQPSDQRHREAIAAAAELALPGLRNTASFEQLLGTAGKGISSAKTAAEILKLLNPRKW